MTAQASSIEKDVEQNNEREPGWYGQLPCYGKIIFWLIILVMATLSIGFWVIFLIIAAAGKNFQIIKGPLF